MWIRNPQFGNIGGSIDRKEKPSDRLCESGEKRTKHSRHWRETEFDTEKAEHSHTDEAFIINNADKMPILFQTAVVSVS